MSNTIRLPTWLCSPTAQAPSLCLTYSSWSKQKRASDAITNQAGTIKINHIPFFLPPLSLWTKNIQANHCNSLTEYENVCVDIYYVSRNYMRGRCVSLLLWLRLFIRVACHTLQASGTSHCRPDRFAPNCRVLMKRVWPGWKGKSVILLLLAFPQFFCSLFLWDLILMSNDSDWILAELN